MLTLWTKDAFYKEEMRDENGAVRLGDGGLLRFSGVTFEKSLQYVVFTVSDGYNGNYANVYIDEETPENLILKDAFLPANHHKFAKHTASYAIQGIEGVHDVIIRVRYSAPRRHAPLLHTIEFTDKKPEGFGFYYGSAKQKNVPVRDIQADTWAFTDDLGRSAPEKVRELRKDKKVIAFYFIANAQESHDFDIYDNSKILYENPEDPAFGPEGSPHYWAEPYFGYYSSKDAWVIRRHAAMLYAAGVDAVCLDVTNHTSYDDVILTIFETFAQMRAEGNPTPQIMFIMPNDACHAADSAKHLYNLIYKDGCYEDLWFRFGKDNKPLICGGPEDADEITGNFFEWRRNWAWTGGLNFWTWVAHTPQPYAYLAETPDVPEEISVSAAQHATTNIGRSYKDGKQPEYHTRYGTEFTTSGEGIYFQEQFDCAIAQDPEVMFITGFNEFTATKFLPHPGSVDSVFLGKKLTENDPFWVDLFSPEYSRDIEPIRGFFGDNYYYQMAANIRAYKGARELPAAQEKAIDINGDFSQWGDVTYTYENVTCMDIPRKHMGNLLCTEYTNDTGRNDFAAAKVAYDAENVYFYVRCREDITAPKQENWMTLYINTGNKTAWNGYSHVVNRTTGIIEECTGGWNWKEAGKAEFKVEGKEMMVKVSRAVLGVEGKLNLRFKWADNSQTDGNAQDFMTLGTVAPVMRFDYVMKA